MIYGLTPEQEIKQKAKAKASLITEKPRKWLYNKENQGVLIETEADYEDLKDFFELTKPDCDNKEITVIKVGKAKQAVNKAKRDIEKAKKEEPKKEVKKTVPKKKEEKTEA